MKWTRKFGVLHIQRQNRFIRYPGRQFWHRPGIYRYSNPDRVAVDVSRTRRKGRR